MVIENKHETPTKSFNEIANFLCWLTHLYQVDSVTTVWTGPFPVQEVSDWFLLLTGCFLLLIIFIEILVQCKNSRP